MKYSKLPGGTASYKLDATCYRRFVKISRVIFPGWLSTASLLMVMLLGVNLAGQLAIYNTGIIPSQFYGVLTSKPVEGFSALIVRSLVIIAAVVVTQSVATFFLYFHDFALYDVNHVSHHGVENPDQRIVQDIADFTASVGTTLADIIILPLTIIYYTYSLAQVMSYTGPLSVFGYFIIGLAVNKVLMSPIVAVGFRKDQQEGDFRFAHVQRRTFAESASFLGGSHEEKGSLNAKLDQVIEQQQRLVNWQFALNLWTTLFDYLASILSYFLVAVPILAGEYNDMSSADLSSLISKSSFVAMYLLNSFTTLISKGKDVSDIATYAHRIGELMEKLEAVEHMRVAAISGAAEPHVCTTRNDCVCTANPPYGITADYEQIAFEDVSFGVPGSEAPLFSSLSFSVRSGENMLISGPSGCGKTSLVRVLLGLWPATSGVVSRPARVGQDILFLAQRPFLREGSLLDLLEYPDVRDKSQVLPSLPRVALIGHKTRNFALAKDVLSIVGLMGLVDRANGLDTPMDWEWYSVLSQGEQQRLAFARLLFHAPPFAVLDEATSALSEDAEQVLYSECQRRGITVLSVGHRLSLVKLDSAGGWTITQLRTSASSTA